MVLPWQNKLYHFRLHQDIKIGEHARIKEKNARKGDKKSLYTTEETRKGLHTTAQMAVQNGERYPSPES